jgi:hypothetical protein
MITIIYTFLFMVVQYLHLSTVYNFALTNYYHWISKRTSLEKVEGNVYDLHYYYNGKPYAIRMRMKRGPHPIVKVVGDSGNDITDSIRAYMGPNGTFYACTPSDFGEDQLTFYDSKNESFVCQSDEPIVGLFTY